jgi:hypothetical protein
MFRYLFLIISISYLTACGQTKSENQNKTMADSFVPLSKNQKLDTVYFWKIMDHAFAKGGFDNKVKEQVIFEQLIKLTPEQIQDFEIVFQQMNQKASTWGNLAAQTVIEGGSSDDRFYYFRCWLISLGKRNFDAAVENADHLASLDIPINKSHGGIRYCQFEELIPMADRAYEAVTGKDEATDLSFPRSNAEKLGLFYDTNTKMTGTEWHENEELPKIVPLLHKKYPD